MDSVELIIIVVVIVSLILLFLPENKPTVKVQDFRYDKDNNLMCLVVHNKDLYFIKVRNKWYSYPDGLKANKTYTDICDKLSKPM